MSLSGIEPEEVWKYFSAMSAIPRCSGHERQVSEYIVSLAKERGLEYRRDEAGNLAVIKPAANGGGGRPVILQGHLDMVCVKREQSTHDFSRDPITLQTEGDWLSADGTSLGADNGIGAAMILAALFSETAKHGPLTALFTVEEETGLIGASALDKNLASGEVLINLDTEEEGELYIGCAGGKIIEAELDLEREDCPPACSRISVEVSGLHGGHSGLEIGRGYANAIHCALKIVSPLMKKYGFVLSDMNAPGKHNAIPVYCKLSGAVPDSETEAALASAKKTADEISRGFLDIDPDISIEVKSEGPAGQEKIINAKQSARIIKALSALPHGVLEYRRDVEDLVNTSVNFAVAEMMENKLIVNCSQRSFVREERDFAADKMTWILELAGFAAECKIEYPPWTPDTDSPLLEICTAVWKELSGKDALVKAVHAGLECGVLGERLGKMDMISIGPDMKEVHTVNERLSVSSTARVWKYLLAVLERLA